MTAPERLVAMLVDWLPAQRWFAGKEWPIAGIRVLAHNPLEGEPPIPLGNRIIEVPEFPERTEMMRDPRGGFVAYAPVGSLARGEALVTTGASKTVQCSVCHGQDNMGLGPIPGIAGRTASYIMRQLWDMKQGTRASPLMAPVIANLTQDEMLAISAYIASLSP